MKGARLFLSYTGLLEPLGASQVVPYVTGLARRGHALEVLSFERPGSPEADRERLRQTFRTEGIAWRRHAYHKRPPVLSTLFDIGRAFVDVVRAAGQGRVALVHARSHVMACAADLARSVAGVPYLFDHRGLMAEEYADSGVWARGGVLYKATQAWERRFLRRASGVVVLTERLRVQLEGAARRIEVIPCAVDLSQLRPARGDEPRPYELVYAGSWTGVCLREETKRAFEAYRQIRPAARFLLLLPAGSDPGPLPPAVDVRAATPAEVPAWLRCARAGISLRRRGVAQTAASPVKVSEYLATGLPVLSSSGVGDLDTLLTRTRTGVLLAEETPAAIAQAVAALAALVSEGDDTAARCRRVAEEQFSLESAVTRYDRLYRAILDERGEV